MKVFLDHIKSSTMPHDMMEDFVTAGVKFYDGMPKMKVKGLYMLTLVTRVSNCADPRPQKDTVDFFRGYK